MNSLAAFCGGTVGLMVFLIFCIVSNYRDSAPGGIDQRRCLDQGGEILVYGKWGSIACRLPSGVVERY